MMTNQTHKNNTTMMSSINQNYIIDTVIIWCQKGIVCEQWNTAECSIGVPPHPTSEWKDETNRSDVNWTRELIIHLSGGGVERGKERESLKKGYRWSSDGAESQSVARCFDITWVHRHHMPLDLTTCPTHTHIYTHTCTHTHLFVNSLMFNTSPCILILPKMSKLYHHVFFYLKNCATFF